MKKTTLFLLAVMLLVSFPFRRTKTESAPGNPLERYQTPGSVVTFGRYTQTEDGTDPTPIQWVVLDYDEENNRTLLLSKYGLDVMPYNRTKSAVTWENCTLRAWLNGEFLDKAFNEAEQAAILTTVVDNSARQGYRNWDTYGGNDTLDRMFLLSYAEANRYMDISMDNDNNIKSRAAPTAYAKAQRAWTSRNDLTAAGAEGEQAGYWWLRSPGLKQDRAAYVDSDGSLSNYDADDRKNTVRPAFWLDLDSDILSEYCTDDPLALYRIAGSVVTLGRYPQTAEGKDRTPIEWVVLDYDEENNKALLLSRYGLDAMPYEKSGNDITWEQCSLRAWLNTEFLNNAFSLFEQPAILVTEVDNSASQGESLNNSDGGNNTQDRIFLLSYAEARRYLDANYIVSINSKSLVVPTAYAISRGAWTRDSDRTEDGEPAGWWWLRSPGFIQSMALRVDSGSAVSFDSVYDGSVTVRPAFWLDLDSDLF